MAQHGAVSNLPPADTFNAVLAKPSVCGACQEGGQKAVSFPRTPISAKTVQPYAKLHIDISGPRNQSLGGSSYVTVMVDDATGFIWVFTYATKDQSAAHVMDKISALHADGHKVKAIRSDRDGVYMSARFQAYLKQHHIEFQPTSGGTPQENGHAERAIGVLKQRMQCLLSDSGLRDNLWAEALWHACYLQNISSSTGSITPWELIKGEKPDASHLRIWGCKSWKLIPPERRLKSRDTRRSEQVRYVGIAWPNPKAHRVLTSRGKIDTTRHLEFDESAPPACDARADFSPFLQPDVTIQQQLQVATPISQTTTPAAEPLQEPNLQVPAPIEASDQAAATQQEGSCFPGNVTENPLFEDEGDTDASRATLVPAHTNIPAPPRRSTRSNINVPPARFDPGAYSKYAHGLPDKRVTFADSVAFQQ
jgi:hypothetical protein